MRVLVSMICLVGALLLIAASIFMNWSFWTGQGADPSTAHVLGTVSIGIDVFKASLPLVIAWAWAERFRLGTVIGMLFFCGCLLFSFFSAAGFAASSRGAVTGSREAASHRYAATEQELKDVKERLVTLGTIRPHAVIEEALAKAKQDRRWSSSKECQDATIEASRSFCRGVGDLRIELASAVESERLQGRSTVLKAEIDLLLSAGARLEQDQQAGLLARVTGFRLDRMQTLIVVLFAVLVELGAAFGLFLAILPLRGRGPAPARSVTEFLPSTNRQLGVRQRPTRFVRAADGQLMIE